MKRGYWEGVQLAAADLTLRHHNGTAHVPPHRVPDSKEGAKPRHGVERRPKQAAGYLQQLVRRHRWDIRTDGRTYLI